MIRAARVDSNQPEIVTALRKVGCVVVIVSQLKNLCDIAVLRAGVTYWMEIKDGTKPPSQRKLTPGELKCKSDFESVGVAYNIVNSIDEALHIINN